MLCLHAQLLVYLLNHLFSSHRFFTSTPPIPSLMGLAGEWVSRRLPGALLLAGVKPGHVQSRQNQPASARQLFCSHLSLQSRQLPVTKATQDSESHMWDAGNLVPKSKGRYSRQRTMKHTSPKQFDSKTIHTPALWQGNGVAQYIGRHYVGREKPSKTSSRQNQSTPIKLWRVQLTWPALPSNLPISRELLRLGTTGTGSKTLHVPCLLFADIAARAFPPT